MQFRYPLPERLIAQALALTEFANGGAQCHARLRSGTVHPGLLLSNGTAIIAMRGHTLLPFEVSEIESLFQTDEDQSPTTRSGWEFFDKWNA